MTIEDVLVAIEAAGFTSKEQLTAVMSQLNLYLAKFKLEAELNTMLAAQRLLMEQNQAEVSEKQTQLNDINSRLASFGA